MNDIGKAIVHMEIPESTMREILDPFYKCMEDNGIEWATEENDNGKTGASYPWTMAKNHFIQSVVQQIEWAMLMDLFEDE